MQGLVDEILISPTPLVAVLGDSAETLEILTISLKAAGLPRSGVPTPQQLRYEPYSHGHRFLPRQRSHSEQEYASYCPQGILASDWLRKHQALIPSVLVRAKQQSAPAACRRL